MNIVVIDKNLIPTKNNSSDAGFDLRTSVDIYLKPGESAAINTGVSMAIPEGYMGLVTPRSGLGSLGLTLKNTIGIIDSSYRGNILAKLKNTGENIISLEKYQRFAQIIIIPILSTDLKVVDKLDETTRGDSGYGSSGVQ